MMRRLKSRCPRKSKGTGESPETVHQTNNDHVHVPKCLNLAKTGKRQSDSATSKTQTKPKGKGKQASKTEGMGKATRTIRNKVRDKQDAIKKRVPTPEELEERKEIHRIHERERHHCLNLALGKIICALPSCGPNEPETKHYVLKKTHDYIQFLEDKISKLSSELNITPIHEDGLFTFSEPLHIFIDGCEQELPAETPVTYETLQKLMASLNTKVSKSHSRRSKRKPQKRGSGNLASHVAGSMRDACSGDGDNKVIGRDAVGSDQSSESTVFTEENGTDQDTESSSMICSESPSDLDTSGVSQVDSSTSSNWGTTSLDDGFSSCKTDCDLTQSPDSSSCFSNSSPTSHVLPVREETLADLMKCAGKKKNIQATLKSKQYHLELLQKGKHPTKISGPHSFAVGKSTVPCTADTLMPSGIQLQSPYQDATALTFYTMPTGSGTLAAQQNVAVACCHPQPDSLVLPSISPTVALQPNVEQPANYFLQTLPSINRSSLSTLPFPANNILNQTRTDGGNSPTYGYISCSLTHGSGDKVLTPAPLTASHAFHQYHQQPQQGTPLQPVRQTVEIILDVGPIPAVLDSYCGSQLTSRRSPINGYQLFSKVNQKRFRDGWPPLKSREISRLVNQAWQEIPEKYKVLYSQRASEWNRWHKARRDGK